MTDILLAAADADGGDAFLGFLIVCGLLWLVCWAISKKPTSYDFIGKIKPRK